MEEKKAWHDAYPQPRNQSPGVIDRKDLLARLQKGEQAGIDFLLVDLRRTDYEGGTIRGSINLPAQSLYNSLPTLLNLCEKAKINIVIWYCGRSSWNMFRLFSELMISPGSSRGRGTRAAGWFDDLIHDRNVTDVRSVILLDGIKGWAKAGTEYTEWMTEYDAAVWKKD